MKKLTVLAIVCLLLSSAIVASEYDSEADEIQRKTRELNELAERFKAETGFTGRISHDLNRMCLGTYEGRFVGIQVTAESDTSTFRAAFEQVLDKVLPYTFAKPEQLVRSRITNNLGRIKTEYLQQINGYRVEGAGKLSIVYETGRNGFFVGNGTVELPDEPIGEIIPEAEAYRIALELHKQTEFYNPSQHLRSRTVIAFKSRNLDGTRLPYRLCWRVSFPSVSYFVDAITKEIWWERNIRDHHHY